MTTFKYNYVVEAGMYDSDGREHAVNTQFGDDMMAAIEFASERRRDGSLRVHRVRQIVDIHEEQVLVDYESKSFLGDETAD